jgi:ribonuclease Z
MAFELTILGSNAAIPAHGRNMTAQYLNFNENCFLIDCAEATQMRMQLFKVKALKVDHIFISHLHGDHIFGLPGLILSMSLSNRRDKLFVFSPPGLKMLMQTLFSITQSHLSFPVEFIETDPSVSTCIYENEKLSVTTLPLKHRIAAHGFLFREKPLPRKMLKEKIVEYSIPYQAIESIKNGADWVDAAGNFISNAELTSEPPKSKSYAFCSDTAYSESLIPLIEGVDLLYHEATFMHEMAAHAEITGHSTAKQAAQIAKAAGVKKLIIGHFSSRYDDLQCLLKEAQSVFPNAELAKDGSVFSMG